MCTFSRLSERLQFDDRDLGLRAEGDLNTRVRYAATLTNGEGKNAPDVNDAKSASGRVVVALTDAFRLAGFGGVHDYVGADSATHHARAIGADVEVGTWRKGFYLVAGVVAGDNWLVGTDAGFSSVQALASVYIPLRPGGAVRGRRAAFAGGLDDHRDGRWNGLPHPALHAGDLSVRGGKELGGLEPGLVRHERWGFRLVPKDPGVRLLLIPRGVTGHD